MKGLTGFLIGVGMAALLSLGSFALYRAGAIDSAGGYGPTETVHLDQEPGLPAGQ